MKRIKIPYHAKEPIEPQTGSGDATAKFSYFPKSRGNTDSDMVAFVHAAAIFCRKSGAGSKKNRSFFQSMEKRETELLLRTVPDAITYGMMLNSSSSCVSLPELSKSYFAVLKVMVQASDDNLGPVCEIVPQLQWIAKTMTYNNLSGNDCVVHDLEFIMKTLKDKSYEPIENKEGMGGQPPEDFRTLSVVPRTKDIIHCRSSFIRCNILTGSYDNVQHYLDVNFRMMREDMLRSFRSCIGTCKRKLNDNHGSETCDGYLFTNVKIEFPPRYTLDGVVYTVVVRTPATERNKNKNFRPGSLVCFSQDKFESVTFASIKERDIFSEDEVHFSVVIEHTGEEMSHKLNYVLLEADVYFEPYRHVLNALKTMNEDNFPLADSIVYLDHKKSDMSHLSNSTLTVQCTESDNESADDSPCHDFDVSDDIEKWPICSDLGLDENQMKALHLARTEKLSLIHGPPGTGKTHMGCRIVQSLLENNISGPVMVCSATNQTLDKLLERLLKYTKKIIRLGKQSGNDALKPHFLSNMSEAIRTYNQYGEKSLEDMDDVLKESYYLTEMVCPDLFTKSPKKEVDDYRYAAKCLCDKLNEMYSVYASGKYTFFDDSTLNLIMPDNYKEKIVAGAGCNARVLSRCVMEWLLLYKKQGNVYENCKEIFKNISGSRNETEDGNENRNNSDEENLNVWKIPIERRYALFYGWRKKALCQMNAQLQATKRRYNKLIVKVRRVVNQYTIKILKCADIIGMTTCGAAKYKDLVTEAGPTVLMVEEAAEVFESHVTSALVPTIEQLILIGDHEQLKPHTAAFAIGRDYFLNVSMFERLLKNDAPSVSLTCQYRMRPSITNLLVPEFYEKLTSHSSVYEYPDVVGMAENVFFLQHSRPEDCSVSSRISTNDYEGLFIAKLYEYLLRSGYTRKQITILTTYQGQIGVIQKHITVSDDGEKDTQICTVDSYQGEENDIVLISFVKSNEIGKIGFIAQSNRVCVALSRAKMGLYCIGNFELFASNSDIWKTIIKKLHTNGLIGEKFPIRCKQHTNAVIHVQYPDELEDFLLRGCGVRCDTKLACGHRCHRSCHFDDPQHLDYRCSAPCLKSIEVEGQKLPCRKKCWETCLKPKRYTVELPCGHELRCKMEDVGIAVSKKTCVEEISVLYGCGHLLTIPCKAKNERPSCKALVRVKLHCGHQKLIPCHKSYSQVCEEICHAIVCKPSPCGHTVEVPCWETDFLPYCMMSCDEILGCGHPCTGSCSSCSKLRIHEACLEECELLLPCGHKCQGLCGFPCPDCKRACENRCEHTTCPNPCIRPCVKCMEPCIRGCEHKMCLKKCWEPCQPCEMDCQRNLPCGHQCTSMCGLKCPPCELCSSDQLGNRVVQKSLRLVMLEDCEHLVRLDELTYMFEKAYSNLKWPSCKICKIPIRRNKYVDRNLKKLKSIILRKSNVHAHQKEITTAYKLAFRNSSPIRWKFLVVCRDINRIMDEQRPSWASFHVLSHCIRALAKLYSMEGIMEKSAPDIVPVFDKLILWIGLHLNHASFQQLEEMHAAVERLERNLDEAIPIRYVSDSDS